MDISGTGLSSLDLSARLLKEAGVATTPGLDFDPGRGAHWLRLSYAGTEPDVAEGMDRIAGWMGANT